MARSHARYNNTSGNKTVAEKIDMLPQIDPNKPVGYYTNWDTYGRNFQPENIAWSKLGAALYAFAESGACWASNLAETTDADWSFYKTSGTVPCPQHASMPGLNGKLDHLLHSSDPASDFPNDVSNAGWGKNNIAKFVDAAHANNVPAILSVGGWSFSIALLDSIKKAPDTLIKSSVEFINKHGFDGIDIDLEPYSNDWTQMSDKEVSQFVKFMTDLKAALPEGKLLTAAISTHPKTAKKIGETNMKALDKALDHLFIMAYDMHGAFSKPPITNFQASFKYDDTQPDSTADKALLNVATAIHAYTQTGMTPAKLSIGYASYGRSVAGVQPGPNGDGLYQDFKSIGEGTWEAGALSYWSIAEKIQKGSLVETFNEKAQAISAYDKSAKMFVSYDSPKTVQIKACYSAHKGLGGLMTWSLYDDKFGKLLDAANPTFDPCAVPGKDVCEQYKSMFTEADAEASTAWTSLLASSDVHVHSEL